MRARVFAFVLVCSTLVQMLSLSHGSPLPESSSPLEPIANWTIPAEALTPYKCSQVDIFYQSPPAFTLSTSSQGFITIIVVASCHVDPVDAHRSLHDRPEQLYNTSVLTLQQSSNQVQSLALPLDACHFSTAQYGTASIPFFVPQGITSNDTTLMVHCGNDTNSVFVELTLDPQTGVLSVQNTIAVPPQEGTQPGFGLARPVLAADGHTAAMFSGQRAGSMLTYATLDTAAFNLTGVWYNSYPDRYDTQVYAAEIQPTQQSYITAVVQSDRTWPNPQYSLQQIDPFNSTVYAAWRLTSQAACPVFLTADQGLLFFFGDDGRPQVTAFDFEANTPVSKDTNATLSLPWLGSPPTSWLQVVAEPARPAPKGSFCVYFSAPGVSTADSLGPHVITQVRVDGLTGPASTPMITLLGTVNVTNPSNQAAPPTLVSQPATFEIFALTGDAQSIMSFNAVC